MKSAYLVEQMCSWDHTPLLRRSPRIDEKQDPAGARFLLGEHPPSRICERGMMSGGGGRYS